MARPEIIEEPTEKKSHFWLILFFVFVGIFMFIFFTTFYEEGMKTLGIKIKGPVLITIGNQEIHLNKSSSFVIENYEGKFTIEANVISNLHGTADQVFLDGTPIKEKKGTTKVSFDRLDYNYIEMREIHLNTLSYSATGILKINDGKFLINLVEEEFYVNDFVGDLEINKNYLRINGNARDFDANKILENK